MCLHPRSCLLRVGSGGLSEDGCPLQRTEQGEIGSTWNRQALIASEKADGAVRWPPPRLSSLALCFSRPFVRWNNVGVFMQGPATGPEGTGPAGLPSPFQPLDLSYSVTARASDHTADRQQSRPREQGPFWGCNATSLSHCCFHMGTCGPFISQAGGSHADGLSSICSEARSFESS